MSPNVTYFTVNRNSLHLDFYFFKRFVQRSRPQLSPVSYFRMVVLCLPKKQDVVSPFFLSNATASCLSTRVGFNLSTLNMERNNTKIRMQWASNQGNEELTVNLGHINQDPLLSVTETATFSVTRFMSHKSKHKNNSFSPLSLLLLNRYMMIIRHENSGHKLLGSFHDGPSCGNNQGLSSNRPKRICLLQ